MDSISAYRGFNSDLVTQLLTVPTQNGKKGFSSGRNAHGMSQRFKTFDETLAEVKAAYNPGPEGPPQEEALQPAPMPVPQPDGKLDPASMTTDDILAYSAAMIQKQAQANATRANGSTLQIRITEVNIEMVSIAQEGGPNPQQQTCDPLVLDLNGDGRISTTTAQAGVKFDINADGTMEQTAVTSGLDGLLALDKDGDGRLTDGSELFGDQNGRANGFLELSRYDDNSDGVIDSNDGVFGTLKIATLQADGTFQMASLADHGISRLNLANTNTYAELGGGSYISQAGSFETIDGRERLLADANFAYIA